MCVGEWIGISRKLVKMSFPIFVTSELISVIYAINMIWIANTNSSMVVSGASLGESIFNMIATAWILGFTMPLSYLCGKAYGAQYYPLVGIWIQRSFMVGQILFVVIALLFWFSESILINILKQHPLPSHHASIYLRYLILAVWPLLNWKILRRYLQSQKLHSYVWITVAIGIMFELFGFILFDNRNVIFETGNNGFKCCLSLSFEGAVLSLSFCYWFQLLSMLILTYFTIKNSSKKRIERMVDQTKTVLNERTSLNRYFNDNNNMGNTNNINNSNQHYGSLVSQNTNNCNNTTTAIENGQTDQFWAVCTWNGWNYKEMFNIDGLKHLSLLSFHSTILFCCEMYSSQLQTFIAGWLSPNDLASFALTHNIVKVVIKIPVALSVAINILMSIKIGKRDIIHAKNLWRVGSLLTLIITFIVSFIIYIQKDFIADLYMPLNNSNNVYDKNEMSMRKSIHNQIENICLPYLSVYIIFYQGYSTLSWGLQAIGKQSVVSKVNFVVLFCFGICLSLILSLYFELGMHGLWLSLCISTFVAWIVLLFIKWNIDWEITIDTVIKTLENKNCDIINQMNVQFKHIMQAQTHSSKSKNNTNDTNNNTNMSTVDNNFGEGNNTNMNNSNSTQGETLHHRNIPYNATKIATIYSTALTSSHSMPMIVWHNNDSDNNNNNNNKNKDDGFNHGNGINDSQIYSIAKQIIIDTNTNRQEIHVIDSKTQSESDSSTYTEDSKSNDGFNYNCFKNSNNGKINTTMIECHDADIDDIDDNDDIYSNTSSSHVLSQTQDINKNCMDIDNNEHDSMISIIEKSKTNANNQNDQPFMTIGQIATMGTVPPKLPQNDDMSGITFVS